MTYFDRVGQKIGVLEWCAMYKHSRDVAEHVDGNIIVSTKWTGLDSSWEPPAMLLGVVPMEETAPPRIYETAVFDGKEWRRLSTYSTEDEARRGHKHTVDELRPILERWQR